MNAFDFDGSGKASILVASAWGIALLARSGSGLTAKAMTANGTRLGGWLLNTADNQMGPIGDFDGDGKAELLIRSAWGLGVLERSGEGWSAPFLTANGTRIGGWLLNTADNHFQAVGDLDGDGQTEILVTSPWGIGILKLVSGALTAPVILANGTRIGGWLLNTADNHFPIATDLDGDGRTELLVTSPWGVAILQLSGSTLSTAFIAANGTRFGDWVLNTAEDRFELAGDLDGDGRSEILVSSARGIGVLAFREGTLTSITTVTNEAWIGGWRLQTAKNRFGPAADLDGDGRLEIVVASDWGLGILEWDGSQLAAPIIAANGTRLGDWRLNTRDNRFNIAGAFDGGHQGKLLITSPWGIGILGVSSGALVAFPMVQSGTRIGAWFLNTADNDLEAGNWDGRALIVYHDQWKWSIDQARSLIERRGLRVDLTDKAADGLARLKVLATTAKAGDRLFVYLAGHGSNPRPPGSSDKAYAAEHYIQFNQGDLYVRESAPLFEALANHGADLSVLDGSCNGGETVLHAEGQRYCAMATTGANSPSRTGFPGLDIALQAERKPSTFGLWWADPHLMASWLNGEIIRGATTRFHQRLFRNDNSPLANVFLRPALDYLKILDMGGWNLRGLNCYLYQHIYPNDYAALSDSEKAMITNDTQTYLDSMNGEMDLMRPFIAQLKSVLADTALMGKAADVYTAGFSRAWQMLAGDSSWNITSEPDKYKGTLYDLSPSPWVGNAGFRAIVDTVLANIGRMEQWYASQERLLQEIDAAVKAAAKRKALVIPRLTKKSLPIRSPSDPAWYQEYNTMELKVVKRHQTILEQAVTSTHVSRSVALKSKVSQVLAPKSEVSQVLALVKKEIKGRRTTDLADLVAEFKAISVVHSHTLGQSSFLLSLVEDATAGVKGAGWPHPGDLNLF